MFCGCTDEAVIEGSAADFLIDVVIAAGVAFDEPNLVGVVTVLDSGYFHFSSSIIYKYRISDKTVVFLSFNDKNKNYI